MKYALQLMLRFDTKKKRDELVNSLKQVAQKRFDKDDAYIQTHICYHDENPTKPCEIETIWHPS